jgi:hypothetical protein
VELEINGARVASVQRGLCTGLNIDVFRDDLSGGSNIRSLPGQDLRVRVTRLPLGYYVMSMTFGALDLANGPVRLPAFLGNSKIEVVLTKTLPSGARPGTKVRGQTSGLYLPRRSDIRLALTPVSQPAGMIERTGQMFVFADGMTGTFEIPDMTPGRYRLSVAGISATSLGLDDDFAGASVTFDVGQSDVTNLEARFEPTSIRRVEREQPVAQTPASTVSLDGTVQVDGAIPQFEIRFTPTQSSATPSVRISGSEFSIELPEGEYSRVVISDLPNGFTVTSVSAGPLDLRSPFLVSAAGIRDRLTGKFVGAESGKARITIRLSSPGLRP